MISNFPDLMYYILAEAPPTVAGWAEVVGAVLGFCLAIVLVRWLILFPSLRWRWRLLRLLASFLCMSIGFGFVYHLMYRHNPTHFKLNAPLEISKIFIPIEEHQELLDKI